MLIYRKAYGFYACGHCKKPYPKEFIEACIENEYTPNPNFCMNCGKSWSQIYEEDGEDGKK